MSAELLGLLARLVLVAWARCLRLSRKKKNTAGVVYLAHDRGDCAAFWSRIPSLLVVSSFACSVTSLSLSPDLQLPGCHGLHHGILASYQLDWGEPSTYSIGHVLLQRTPPNLIYRYREYYLPMTEA